MQILFGGRRMTFGIRSDWLSRSIRSIGLHVWNVKCKGVMEEMIKSKGGERAIFKF